MQNLLKAVFGLFILAACVVPVDAAEAKIRIVFFTPSDVTPPASVENRMKEVVDYAQNFYSKWLNHWGYDVKNVLPVDRNENGIPKIYYVKGDENAASGKYDNVGFQGLARNKAIEQYKIPREGSTWWIFVYGTKLRASRGWGGFSDRYGNGIALLVWHDIPGKLDNKSPLAGGIADQINLKGYLHELGHTMNLAHFGPLDQHTKEFGMSLMGVNARGYRSAKRNREQKVHLTEATAAIIWKQSQITGQHIEKPKQPTVEVKNFQPNYDARSKQFVLSGQLKSDVKAHSIVAIDAPEKGPTDYWKKAYASKLKTNGEFELKIDELAPSSGELLVFFCFDNGYFTGTGKGYGYKHSAKIPYRFNGQRYLIGK